MNTIIITTHSKEEFDNLKGNTNYETVEGQYYFSKFSEEQRQVVVIRKIGQIEPLHLLIDSLTEIVEPKIFLYHQVNLNLNPKFNVSTAGDGVANRSTYQLLLDAQFAGQINTEVKKKDFDKVWEYFSEKNQKELLERKKTDFLYSIYNGKTPAEFPKEITLTNEITQLYTYFTEHKYEKQWDLDYDESKGAEQRQKLSLLRDALLASI